MKQYRTEIFGLVLFLCFHSLTITVDFHIEKLSRTDSPKRNSIEQTHSVQYFTPTPFISLLAQVLLLTNHNGNFLQKTVLG